jgi:hypothetical protein
LEQTRYVFDPQYITRPLDSAIAGWLPMAMFSPTIWLLLFFIAFFVVIVALI